MDPSSEAPRSAVQRLEDQQAPESQSGATAAQEEAEPDPITTHFARFEFGSDGNETKVLMVEWDPASARTALADDSTPDRTATSTATKPAGTSVSHAVGGEVDGWAISWPGKSTNLPAKDTDQDGERRRVFFLLPPDAPIPATITISSTGSSANGSIYVKPLPAIFPDGFDNEAGTRGVLHTLWAKKRVAELDREVEAELRANSESVGVEMAMGEKQWIIDNFLRPPQQPAVLSSSRDAGGSFMTPSSPRSPAGRLGEKLKGLKLATTPADLVPSPTANTFIGIGDPRSRGDDIAVSSMSAISQSNRARETASLDAALSGATSQAAPEEDDDLFALPMSPRSPDMKKSPFSMLK